MAEVAELFRRFRTAAGLTQEQLAERTGLSVGAIRTLEAGRRRHPRLTTIDKLVDGLGLTADQRRLVEDAARRPAAAPQADDVPNAPDDFVGRTDALTELTTRLAAGAGGAGVRVVALSGMGGVGKTALAVHAARQVASEYPDGVLYLNLRAHGGGTPPQALELLTLLLGRLGAREAPADLAVAAARYRSVMATRRLLVLLDDAATAGQVEPLLPGTGRSAVLVTSRPRLSGLAGAHHLSLGVLPEPEALELLAAVSARPVDRTSPAATAIVRSCGMLPLAIRIAGSSLADRQGDLRQLADALADEHARLEVLSDGDTGVRAALNLSVSALATGDRPAERTAAAVLPLLSVLEADVVTLRTARAALDLPLDDTESALEHLVDVSLLDTPALHLYRLHDLVRAVGRERTDEATRTLVRRRLLDHYVAVLWRADALSPFPRPDWYDPAWTDQAGDLSLDDALDIVDTERDGLIRSVRSAAHGPEEERTRVVRLAPAFNHFAKNRKRWSEWREVNQLAAGLVDEATDPLAAWMVRFDLGLASNELGDFEAGQAELHEALRLARGLGNRNLEGRCLINLAHALEQCDRLGPARAITLQFVALTQQDGDETTESWGHLLLGVIAGKEGDLEAQQTALRRSIELFDRPTTPPTMLAMRHLLIGESYRTSGRYDLAMAALLESVRLYRDADRQNGVAEALDHLAAVYFDLGRFAEALAHHDEALVLAGRHSLWDREANIRVRRGRTWRALGRLEEARQDWQVALQLYEAHGAPAADQVRELLAAG